MYGSAGVVGVHDEALQQGPGVVIGRKGNVGSIHWSHTDFFPIDTTFYLVPKTTIQLRYFYYLLKTLPLPNMNTDVAVPGLNRVNALRLKVHVPSIAEQRRIAAVLSAYDDLMENNRRRIALLEQAAREFYREWFVRLRFPGHDKAKVVDGLPEGWKRGPLENVGRLRYGKSLKAEDRIDGDYPVYGSSGIVGTHDTPHVRGPGIIVGRKGNVGSVYWSDSDFCAIDTVYFVESPAVTLFLYYALKNIDFINTDVAVPGLNRKLAHSREFLLPSSAVQRAFNQVVETEHKQIALLRSENSRLEYARDLLLTRLMSREVTI